MKGSTILALFWAAVAAASRIQVESVQGVPEGWTRVSAAPAGSMITLRVALVQPGYAEFEKRFMEIADPDSPKYGQFLPREEARAMLSAAPESLTAVKTWLHEAGVTDDRIEDLGDWINFSVSVSEAEKLLDTEFGIYRHTSSGTDAVRTLGYSVPESVREHLTFVQPTTRFGDVAPKASTVFSVGEPVSDAERSEVENAARRYFAQGINPTNPGFSMRAAPNGTVGDVCKASLVTAACLRALYRMGNVMAPETPGAVLGVAGYLEEWAKHDQLDRFYKMYAPYAIGHDFNTVLVNGGKDDQNGKNDDVEANLDIQYAGALGFKNTLTYYSSGGRGELVPDKDQPDANKNENEPYMQFFQYLLSLPNDQLPMTLTTSYGENEQSVPAAYAMKVCSMIGELGSRGVTVLFSSGDFGPGSACESNDGQNRPKFNPTFPGACPFVTSVGGTERFDPEQVWPHSQGGFSDLFPRPDYQKQVVDQYVASAKDVKDFAQYINKNGRGFPDIAAGASNYAVYSRNHVLPVGGTSASSPAMAGIISLINTARKRDGKPPLGFMNPWLYKEGKAGFKDITTGRSTGCTGSTNSGMKGSRIPNAGWSAVPGWDPATGFGTPLFDKLYQIANPGGQPLPTFGTA